MNTAAAPSFASEAVPRARPAGWLTTVLLSTVLVLTFIAYAGTLSFQFVYDDTTQIVSNPAIQSWRNLPRLFAEQVWSGQAGVAPNYYRPVFMTWCLFHFKLFGLKPPGWHFGVVLVHLLATALVFFLARRLTSDEITATIAALLFGLNPIHVESVAWISGVTDPLIAVFCLGSFLCYLRFHEAGPRRWAWLAASLVQYALACLSKEPGIVLIGIIACYIWLSARDATLRLRFRQSLTQAAPFAAVAVLYLLQRQHVLRGLAHPVVALPLSKMPLSWPKVWWFYTSKLVLPVQLSPFYDTHYVLTPTWTEFWLPLLGVVAVAVLLWTAIRRLPSGGGAASPRAVAWLSTAWIVLPLLPAMNIVSLEPREIAHDRYLYLPSAGAAILAAMAIRRLRVGRATLFGQPAIQPALVVVLTAAMIVGTVRQSLYWANDLLLYYRGVSISPDSLTALHNLANALLERDYYDEGIRMHERILRADPEFWQSHYSLGNAYFKLGRYRESEEHLLEATRLNPGAPRIAIYLVIAQMKNHHLGEAESTAREIIRAWPTLLGAYYALGLVLEQQRRWPEAADAFHQELALDPDQPKVREELASAERQAE